MTRRPLILIGGGGHALSVAAALAPREVAGYIDLQASDSMPWRYLGNDDVFLSNPSPGAVVITLVSGSDCNLKNRRRLIDRYEWLINEWFAAESAEIDPSAQIGDGTVVMRKAVINCRCKTGRHCIVNTSAVVEHDCKLGDNVFIGPGAVICGGVTIGDDVYIGANATVHPGTIIASGSVIGLGAAVVSDIVEAGVYAGVPAKLLKK